MSVRDRTVTKTCIKLPVVTVWDITSDSPLHWIPCHSSLNGQIDEFMHNWGLYYEKENERSVSPLTVKRGWVGDKGSWNGLVGGRRGDASSPPVQRRRRWGRRRRSSWGISERNMLRFDAWTWGVRTARQTQAEELCWISSPSPTPH